MEQIQFTRECPQCNKSILYKREKDRNYFQKKGSVCKTCSNKNRALNGNFNPKEEFICIICNKNFTEWKSQVSHPDQPTCSKKCGYKSMENDLTGKVFGKLQVLERTRKDRTTFYKCLCSCGNECTIVHGGLINGTKSCGCLIKKVRGNERKPLNEVIPRAIWNYYVRNAKNRNYEWKLTYEEFVNLINGNCYHCGIEKCTPFIWRYKEEIKSLPFNGVDRLDNSIGYITNNCVSCCKHCNLAKNNMSIDDFKSWIIRIYNNLFIL